jgi:hypothetical protein
VDSEYESGKVSIRSKRAAAASAALGRPHGAAPYGYTRTYDPKTRLLYVPAQENLCSTLKSDEKRPTYEPGKRFVGTDAGATRTGKLFTGTHLRSMALSPTYAGMRGHRPGGGQGRYRTLDGVDLAGRQWPALVDMAHWYAVRAR